MSKIKELREEAKRLETEARSKLDEAQAKDVTEDRAAELEGEFDSLMDKRDKLVAQADRMERSDRSAAEMEEIEERAARENRESRRATGASDSFVPDQADADEYREHFRQFLAAGGDVSAISTEARNAIRGNFVEGRAQTGASGPTGGFTVPTTLANFINVAMAAHGPMWDENVASVLTTSGGETMTIPGVDDTAEEMDAHAQGDEPADDDSGDVTLTKTDLVAYTRSSPWIKWAFELAQDSGFSWEQLLGRLIGERIGRNANRLLTVGSGTGEPLGFVTASAKGFDAAAAGAVTFDEIIELEHSVDPAYRGGPRVGYQMHDSTVKALRKIKNNEGDYIWSDGDVTRGVPSSLNGKPVRFNQAMDEIGADAKSIAFGDFGQYYVRKVGAPMIGVAREKFWPNLGIAGVVRFDGALGISGTIKHLLHPGA